MRRYFLALAAIAMCPAVANAATVVVSPGTSVTGPAVLTGSASGTLGTGQSIFFMVSPQLTPSSPPTLVSATFGDTGIPTGNFTDIFTFQSPFPATGSGSVTTSLASLAFGSAIDTDLLSVLFNGMPAPVIYRDAAGNVCPTKGVGSCGASTQFALTNVPILFGPGNFNTITVNGLSRGNGSYGGQGTLVPRAVPEPATWAMMLLGFGAIGFSMRRRRRPVLAQIA
ncbi:MAG TPA: FxDxF family PEP-CTERM protein [Sphingomicrobium sp.]|nr:FxDxF family PEP-CTERM protein [Sphingomicrobium sp.]